MFAQNQPASSIVLIQNVCLSLNSTSPQIKQTSKRCRHLHWSACDLQSIHAMFLDNPNFNGTSDQQILAVASLMMVFILDNSMMFKCLPIVYTPCN